MSGKKKVERYAPRFEGPHFKWYMPLGMLALIVQTAFRYFVSGRELRGAGDNATWFQDATEDYRGRPVEKLTKARWRRLARRWVFLGIPWVLLDLVLLKKLPMVALLAYAGLMLLVALAWGGYLLALWWPQRELRKLYIYPAYRTLAKITGVKYRKRDALASIVLPPDFGEEADGDPSPVRVYMPDVPIEPGAKKRVIDSVAPRLGLPDATLKWTESGVDRVYVDLLPMSLPPLEANLRAIMAELLASPLDQPVVGIGPGGRCVHTDFKNDSPHTLGSAGSGAGKSTLYRFIAMQRMRHGAYAIILDFKKWSHLRWAGKLPSGRVLLEDEPARIHAILCRLLDELVWRKSFDLHQEAELEALPTIDVYVEEINTLMSLLTSYWAAETARQKQAARTALRLAKASEDGVAMEEAEELMAQASGLSKVSPAIEALRFGVNLGREFRIHFHFIGQSMSAKAAGGRDTRESFRTRLLARWDAKTWKMLADGIPFIACPSSSVGIWAHVHGSEVEIVRVPYVSDDEAVEFVLRGEAPSLPMFHGDPLPAIESTAREVPLPSALSLREILALLPPKANGEGMNLEALRACAKRSDSTGFPAPIEAPGVGVAALYSPADVLAWFRDRERIPVTSG